MSTNEYKRLPDAGVARAVDLPRIGSRRPSHLFDEREILAVNAALDCGRPLLVRGEPGTGKSQLARATAKLLEREFVSCVVNARTEPVELMWEHDALRRLGDAQAANKSSHELALVNYITPGPMWWAFAWAHAERQASQAQGLGRRKAFEGQSSGVVLLVDEIDKADVAVPNALLECLGHGEFPVPGIGSKVVASEPYPLIVFTTNTHRALPDAFVRRCVVLSMHVPEGKDFERYLIERAHPSIVERFVEEDRARVIAAAAERVAKERADALRSRLYCPPGLAEFIDLLTALSKTRVDQPLDRLEDLAPYILSKYLQSEGGHD